MEHLHSREHLFISHMVFLLQKNKLKPIIKVLKYVFKFYSKLTFFMKHLYSRKHLFPIEAECIGRQLTRLGSCPEEGREVGVALFHYQVEHLGVFAVFALKKRIFKR